MARRVPGCTLIELMIVLAVGGIFLAIAVPSYNSQVRKTRRAEATARLQQIAVLQEKFRSENPGYTTDWDLLGGDPESPADGNLARFYNWAITDTPAAYTVTATAVGDQVADTGCATLRINNTTAPRDPVSCW